MFPSIKMMSRGYTLQPYEGIPISEKVKSSLIINFDPEDGFGVHRYNCNDNKQQKNSDLHKNLLEID
jgi:hypothetical protein